MAQSESMQLLRRLRSSVGVLDLGEKLADSGNDVRSLGESVLLSQTDSGTSVEGQVLPSLGLRSTILVPSLGSELLGILTPELLESVGGENVVRNEVALSDNNGLHSVGSSSSGKSGVSGGVSHVGGDRGVQSEDLVKDVSQVVASLKGLKGDGGKILAVSKVLKHLLSQLGVDLGSSFHQVQAPGQKRSSGISASKKNVESLVSEHNGVLGLLGELSQEDVLSVVNLLLRLLKGLLNVVVNKSVDSLTGRVELSGSPGPVEHLKSGSLAKVLLGGVEVLLERLSQMNGHISGNGSGVGHNGLGADRLAKQELGSGVKGQVEEELLSIKGRAILGDSRGHVLDVLLDHLHIGDLVSSKLGSKHSSRVLPSLAIKSEDTISENRQELSVSLSETKVLELGGQNGLKVLGIDGVVHVDAENGGLTSVSGVDLGLEHPLDKLQQSVLLGLDEEGNEEGGRKGESRNILGLAALPLLLELAGSHVVLDNGEAIVGQ